MTKRYIVERVDTGEIIIFDTVTKNTHVLNETAALVYEQYNNNCSIDEIVDIIKTNYSEAPIKEKIKVDVEDILNKLKEQEVIG